MEQLKQFLLESNQKTFLDIGTGTGEFLALLDSLYDGYDSMVGIDRMEKMLEHAKQRNLGDKITFEVMDGNAMTYPDDTFDVVCLSNSLHHLEDIEATLREMTRVVKPDGFVLINEMVSDNLSPAQLSHRNIHHFAAKIDRMLGQTHDETFAKEEIVQILTTKSPLQVHSYWEMDVPNNVATPEQITFLEGLLDRLVSRAPEAEQPALSSEANELKQYIQANGYDGCTSLLVLLQKQ